MSRRWGGLLGEPKRVEDASGVAVLAGALEESLQAHERARLRLAARLLEVLPPLDLHKVIRKDLQGDQRFCSSTCTSQSPLWPEPDVSQARRRGLLTPSTWMQDS